MRSLQSPEEDRGPLEGWILLGVCKRLAEKATHHVVDKLEEWSSVFAHLGQTPDDGRPGLQDVLGPSLVQVGQNSAHQRAWMMTQGTACPNRISNPLHPRHDHISRVILSTFNPSFCNLRWCPSR